jgi:predicted GNAT family N-acyltransferase
MYPLKKLSVVREQTRYTEIKECSLVRDLLHSLSLQRVNDRQLVAVVTRLNSDRDKSESLTEL